MLVLGLKYQHYIKKYRFTYLWQRQHKTPEQFFLWPSEFLHSICWKQGPEVDQEPLEKVNISFKYM